MEDEAMKCGEPERPEHMKAAVSSYQLSYISVRGFQGN